MQPKHEPIHKNDTNTGNNRNENAKKNYKQNKGRQNEKRKNTGNMWDPNNNILGTEWSVHVSRMSEDRLVRRVYDAAPVGKRNRGRQMKRWRDALV